MPPLASLNKTPPFLPRYAHFLSTSVDSDQRLRLAVFFLCWNFLLAPVFLLADLDRSISLLVVVNLFSIRKIEVLDNHQFVGVGGNFLEKIDLAAISDDPSAN